jgi:hypothetical protein
MAAQLTWAIRALISSSCGGRIGRRLRVNAISTWAARHMHTVKDREGECYCFDKGGSRGW